jgi:hypothetical protein
MCEPSTSACRASQTTVVDPHQQRGDSHREGRAFWLVRARVSAETELSAIHLYEGCRINDRSMTQSTGGGRGWQQLVRDAFPKWSEKKRMRECRLRPHYSYIDCIEGLDKDVYRISITSGL